MDLLSFHPNVWLLVITTHMYSVCKMMDRSKCSKVSLGFTVAYSNGDTMKSLHKNNLLQGLRSSEIAQHFHQ